MFSLRLQENLLRYAKIAKHESIFIEEMDILKDNVQHLQKGTELCSRKSLLSLVPFLVSDRKISIITPYQHVFGKAVLTNLKSYNKMS